MEERYRFDPRIQSLFGVVEVMHLPIWRVGGLISTPLSEVGHTPQVLMMNPALSS